MKGTRQSEEPIIAILKKCGAGDSTAPLLQTSSPLKHPPRTYIGIVTVNRGTFHG